MTERIHTVLLTVIIISSLGVFAPPAGADVPQLPASYHGELVDEEGGEAPAGTEVTAVSYGEVNGNVTSIDSDTIETESAGYYGNPAPLEEKLVVNLGDNPEEVRFIVDYPGVDPVIHDDPNSGLEQFDIEVSGDPFEENGDDENGDDDDNGDGTDPGDDDTDDTGIDGTDETIETDDETDEADDDTPDTDTDTGDEEAEDDPADDEEEEVLTDEDTEDPADEDDPEVIDPTDEDTSLLPVSLPTLGFLLLAIGVLAGLGLVGVEGTVGIAKGVAMSALGVVSSSGGGGVIGIENRSDRPHKCKVRCRTPDETLFVETVAIENGDSDALGDIPQTAFELAIKVKNGPVEKQVIKDTSLDDVTITIDHNGVSIG